MSGWVGGWEEGEGVGVVSTSSLGRSVDLVGYVMFATVAGASVTDEWTRSLK